MSGAFAASSIPTLAPTYRFQWEEAQQCYVVLYPEGMVKLSPSAGEIMKRCDGVMSVQGIVDDLKRQFPGIDLDADVYKFLEVAHDNGWIRSANGL
ncbi:MAG: pyrroloquinoline quinone biosynthesis peptide chaperone PqqD [Gammaproteobacteria bacterium]|nr:pyrroloquinoline quinone biosynthesis peptide chaperone PqqD [Gammaproteobacteria bacterium]